MAAAAHPDTDELLDRAGRGDVPARHQLLVRHRARLTKMVAIRLDRRLAARVDPSDVVQETLAEADRRLDDYLRDRPLPFYPWLRRLAGERLIDLHRRHVRARHRSVEREEPWALPLPDASAIALVDRLAASGTSPSRHLLRQELRQRVRAALDQLAPHDREILVLRHLEQLSVAEAAAALGITERAAKARHMRALTRLRALFEDENREEDR
jgi:RNA polymerase sigma-70 factor (ECF subfamily)